jgi:hypothetical protein
MPIIRQQSDSEPSTLTENRSSISHAVEQTGILKQPAPKTDTTDD